MAVFLGIATVANLFLGNMAAGQAAEQGVVDWAGGGSTASVNLTVTQALQHDGYAGSAATTSLTSNGTSKSVTVAVPVTLWNTGRLGMITASRTLTSSPGVSSGSSAGGAPPPHQGGGGGGGGYIYHHFPMW